MSSNLRVDRILPSTGTEVGVGTATGSVALYGDVNVAGTLTYEDVTNIDSVGVITARKGIVSSGVVTATAFHGDGSNLTGITQTTINNNTNNYVVTATGTANTLQGESNLTYDGTDLVLNHATGDKALRWATGGTNKWSIYHNNGAGALVAYDNANNAERLRITSSGDIGIGENTPETLLHLSKNGGQATITLEDPSNSMKATLSAGTTRLDIGTPGSHGISFFTNNAHRLRIDSSGNVNIGVNAASNPFTYLRFGASQYGAADIRPTNEASHKVGLAFYTDGTQDTTINPTEKLRITSTGLLGIGTDDPQHPVHLYNAGSSNVFTTRIQQESNNTPTDGGALLELGGTRSDGTYGFYGGIKGGRRNEAADNKGYLAFFSDNNDGQSLAERMRIDDGGRLLVGTTNSAGTQLIKVTGDTGGTTYGGHIALTQGRTSPGNGATHGVLSFGTETRPEVVKVVSFVDGTWTDGQYHPSGLYIATTDYNRNSPTEKIRITDIGEVNCYSTGSVIQAGTLQGGGYNAYFYEGRRNQNTGGTRTYIVWSNGNVQNTNNSYGSISDQRLKENIVDATSQWDDIKSLQIRKYNFREATGNETHTQIGLIAQEAESVSPGLVQTTAVSGGEVLQDADGNQIESVKSINYSVLYMKSVKALQEAQTRIEALEAAVAALQGS